jgi:hypothetical protein
MPNRFLSSSSLAGVLYSYQLNFFAFCSRFGPILMPSVNPSIWAYQKRRRNAVSFSSQFWCLLWIPPSGLILIPKHGVLFQCFFIELLSLFPLHSVNFEGLDMFQFNTELVSWWLLACLLQTSLQKKKKKLSSWDITKPIRNTCKSFLRTCESVSKLHIN